MSSDHMNDKIIDLLYDELSRDKAREARARLEQDEAASLESYENALRQFRFALPAEEVSSSVHGSIMEQARLHATQKVTLAASSERRPKTARAPSSLWQRLRIGDIAQVAAVAALLLASAVVIRGLSGGESEHEPIPSASMHATAQIEIPKIEMPPGTDPDWATKGIAQETVESEAEAASAALAPAPPSSEDDVALAEESARREELAYAPALGRRGSVDERPASRDDAARQARATRRSTAAPARKQASSDPSARTESRKESASLDLFGDSVRGAAAEKSPAREPKPVEDQLAAKSEMASAPAAKRPAPSAAPRQYDDYAQSAAEEAEEAGPPAQIGHVDRAQQAFDRNDHRSAISAADAALADRSTANSERARALNLKAQSLVRLGRLDEAEATYAELARAHPSYSSESVARARDEIAQRRRASRAKQSADSDEVMFDSEADIAPSEASGF